MYTGGATVLSVHCRIMHYPNLGGLEQSAFPLAMFSGSTAHPGLCQAPVAPPQPEAEDGLGKCLVWCWPSPAPGTSRTPWLSAHEANVLERKREESGPPEAQGWVTQSRVPPSQPAQRGRGQEHPCCRDPPATRREVATPPFSRCSCEEGSGKPWKAVGIKRGNTTPMRVWTTQTFMSTRKTRWNGWLSRKTRTER